MANVDDVFAQKFNDGGIKMPSRLSYSSVHTYSQCGEKYRLEKLHKVDTGTWWATIAGKAIHHLTEIEDRIKLGAGSPGQRRMTFAEAMEHYLETEGKPGQEIKASGRKQETVAFGGGPNKRDKDWWLEFGPQYVAAYVKWRDMALTPVEEGGLGWRLLEIEFAFEEGFEDEAVVGYIDRVFITPEHMIVLVDIKTGVNEPTDSLQLVTYREGFRESTGITADVGNYIFFRWVAPTKPELPPKPTKVTKVAIANAAKALKAHGMEYAGSDSEKGFLKAEAAYKEWEETKAFLEALPQEEGCVEAYLSFTHDLEVYTSAYVNRVYEMARKGIEAQVFLPNTTSNCLNACGVSEFCRAVGGRRSNEYPVTDRIAFRTGKESV